MLPSLQRITAHSSGESPTITMRGRTMETILAPEWVVLGMIALAAISTMSRVILRLTSRPRFGIWLAGVAMSAFLAMNGITWLWYGTWLWNTPNLF